MKKIIMTVLMTFSLSAHAEFFTGNMLLNMLDSAKDSERSMGMGYVAGAFDASQKAVHCSPSNVSLRQAVDMVRKRLVDAPEDRHYSADMIVMSVMKAAFPCKSKPNT